MVDISVESKGAKSWSLTGGWGVRECLKTGLSLDKVRKLNRFRQRHGQPKVSLSKEVRLAAWKAKPKSQSDKLYRRVK